MSGTTQRSERTTAGLGWIPWTTLVLSIAGLAVASYLTYEHFTAGTTLACPNTGVVNCAKVTSESVLQGLRHSGRPSRPGLLRRHDSALTASDVAYVVPLAGRLRLTAVVVGVVFVCYLIWAELFQIDAICLWCTVVHALTLVLFALVIIRQALDPDGG